MNAGIKIGRYGEIYREVKWKGPALQSPHQSLYESLHQSPITVRLTGTTTLGRHLFLNA